MNPEKTRHRYTSPEERRLKKACDEMMRRIVSTLLLIVLLLLSVGIFEIIKANEKYVYTFASFEKKVKMTDVFSDGVQFIEMNSLAEYCSLERKSDGSRVRFSVNGTYMTLEDGSDTVIVNSFERKMPACARVTENAIYVPLQTVLEFIPYLSATVEDKQTVIELNKSKEDIYIVALDGFEIEYATDVSAYLEYINANNEKIHLLVNREKTLSADYVPDDLVEIPAKYRRKDSAIKLSLYAEKALEAMLNDMKAQGVDDVFAQSAYRSYEYQSNLFDYYVRDEMKTGLDKESATQKAMTYSARAGESEHQSGLCIDFSTASIGGAVDDVFESTPAFKWLCENAWKYGFILRYPEDKVDITGYKYESWHYRFVGLDVSAVIHQSGLCFEEYLEIFDK